MTLKRELFGQLDNGEKVEKITLSNKNGVFVELMNYGATIISIKIPSKNSTLTDIVLGFDSIDGYLSKHGKNPYFGAVVGRVANRIANGKFAIDGQSYTLAQNNGTNSLHGGLQGFDKVLWNISENTDDSVTFSYMSKDGEEGFPGDVLVNVNYKLNDDNGLLLSFKGLSSKATPLNLANHVYFNLAGENSGADGLGQHFVTMNASHYLPTDDKQIPTGKAKVEDTVFDLRVSKKLSEQLPKCPGGANNGYDHCYCVDGDSNSFRLMCRIEHKESGRALECHSNQPGVQLYTGNFVPTDDSLKGKNGYFYKKHGGFCLETQTFPDAINQKFDHDSIIRPGQLYNHQVMYKLFF